MRRAAFPLTALAMHALAAFVAVRFVPERAFDGEPRDEAEHAAAPDPNADDAVEVTVEALPEAPSATHVTALTVEAPEAPAVEQDLVAARNRDESARSVGASSSAGASNSAEASRAVDAPNSPDALAAHEPPRDPNPAHASDNVQDATTSHDGSPSDAPPPPGIVTFGARPSVDVGLDRGEALALARSAAGERPSGTAASGDASRAIQESLREGLRRRDETLGLGPDGPVRTALVEGTSRSLAPVRGRATFTVVANAAGIVTGIELLDTDGDRSGWADAARVAFAELKGKKLSLPPGTKSAAMTIEVTSAWKLPNGQDPGAEVSLFGRTMTKGEGKDSAKVTILDPVPKIRMTNITIGSGEPILVPTVQIDLFFTTFDPSNVGAKPRRIVHTRVVETKYM